MSQRNKLAAHTTLKLNQNKGDAHDKFRSTAASDRGAVDTGYISKRGNQSPMRAPSKTMGGHIRKVIAAIII